MNICDIESFMNINDNESFVNRSDINVVEC